MLPTLSTLPQKAVLCFQFELIRLIPAVKGSFALFWHRIEGTVTFDGCFSSVVRRQFSLHCQLSFREALHKRATPKGEFVDKQN